MGCVGVVAGAIVLGCGRNSNRIAAPVDTRLFCDGTVLADGDSGRPADAQTHPIEVRGHAAAGDREPADIQAVIREKWEALRDCYQTALARNPNATGRVLVRFVVQRDGSTTDVCLKETSLLDGPAVSCMLEAYRRLSFPPAERKTTVVYPVAFSPG
jgi:outer membrane biosynthesis protein TonB